MDMKKLKKGTYIVNESEPCIIKGVEFLPNNASPVIKLELEGLFSGKQYNRAVSIHEDLQEAEMARRCATVISKNKDMIEIMDVTTFKTFKADISKEDSAKVQEGDNVTYVSFGGKSRILEVRK
jgi:translation elongation factor P/translation initiation factor 5A